MHALISHRGNTSGQDPSFENNPLYVKEALKLGFDCEIDVWYHSDEYWLGHDELIYDVSKNFLQNNKLWCHAKDLGALDMMLQHDIHCFWHQTDDMTLTSKGHIWTYPSKPVCQRSVIVDLNAVHVDYNCYGVCSDYIQEYKK